MMRLDIVDEDGEVVVYVVDDDEYDDNVGNDVDGLSTREKTKVV